MHIKGHQNMLLWSKNGLDEWLDLTREAISRNKLRRSCQQPLQPVDSHHRNTENHIHSEPYIGDLNCQPDDNCNNECQDQLYENSSRPVEELIVGQAAGQKETANGSKVAEESCDLNVPIKPLPPTPLVVEHHNNTNNYLDISQARNFVENGLTEIANGSIGQASQSDANNSGHKFVQSDQEITRESSCFLDQNQDNDKSQSGKSIATKSTGGRSSESSSTEREETRKSNSGHRLVLRPRPSPRKPMVENLNGNNHNSSSIDRDEENDDDNETERVCSTNNIDNKNNNNDSVPMESDMTSNNLDLTRPSQFNDCDMNQQNQRRNIKQSERIIKGEMNGEMNYLDHVRPVASPRISGQASKLIRRDDSWHSLVSLTRVGRQQTNEQAKIEQQLRVSATPQHLNSRHLNRNQQQDAKRALYAQENGSSNSFDGQQQAIVGLFNRQAQRINKNFDTESMVTPNRRGPSLVERQHQSLDMGPNNIDGQHYNQQHEQQQHDDQREKLADRRKKPSLFGSKRGGKTESASFDMASSNAHDQYQKQQHQQQPFRYKDTSCHRKLLQLQFLQQQQQQLNGSDYQIYDGADTSFQHYGQFGGAAYSSMRSNLKTATSEFAFIRPVSSGLNQQHSTATNKSNIPQQHRNQRFLLSNNHAQSTLPRNLNHKRRYTTDEENNLGLENQITQHNLIKATLALNDNPNQQIEITQSHAFRDQSSNQIMMNDRQQLDHPQQQQQQQFHHGLENNNSINATTTMSDQNENTNGLQLVGQIGTNDQVVVPIWSADLPLKPNKKRKQPRQHLSDNVGQKSSSLTLSIASFFRRAFSGRRRGKRSDNCCLSNSNALCSASLSAFSDNQSSSNHISEVRSAFSTGGKSPADAIQRHKDNQQQHLQPLEMVAQSPRMVDMIEAFQNNTRAAQLTVNADQDIHQQQQHQSSKLDRTHLLQQQRSKLIGLNQVGGISSHQIAASPARFQQHAQASPLHKSNSESVTLNASAGPLVSNQFNQRSNYYDNNLPPTTRKLMEGDFLPSQDSTTSGKHSTSALVNDNFEQSPLQMRSNMPNTPLSTPRLNTDMRPVQTGKPQATSDYQPSAYPRARSNQSSIMPRPSSIYGQPSLISSPSMLKNQRNYQRNSLVGFPDDGVTNHQSESLFGKNHSLDNYNQGNDNNFIIASNKNNFGSHLDRELHHTSGNSARHSVHSNNLKGLTYLDTTREVAEDLDSPTSEFSAQHQQQQQSENNFMIDHHENRRQNRLSYCDKATSNLTIVEQQFSDHHMLSSHHGHNPQLDQAINHNHQNDNHLNQRTNRNSPRLHHQPNSISSSISYSPLNLHRSTVDNPMGRDPNESRPILNSIYDNHPSVLNSSADHRFASQYGQGRFVPDQSSHNQQPFQSHYDNHDGRISDTLLLQENCGNVTTSHNATFMNVNTDTDPYTIRTLNTTIMTSGLAASPMNSRFNGCNINHKQDYPTTAADKFNQKRQILAESNSNSSLLGMARNQNNMIHHQPSSTPLMEPRRSATNMKLADDGGRASPRVVASTSCGFRSPLIATNRHLPARDNIHGNNHCNSPRISDRLILQNNVGNHNNHSGGGTIQAVVNIAGAPGINLHPSLAASLLHGTQIDAYQSVTKVSSRNDPDLAGLTNNLNNNNNNNNNNATLSNSNKFLVSERLSKSIANRKSLGNVAICLTNRVSQNKAIDGMDLDRVSLTSSINDEPSSATNSSSRTNQSSNVGSESLHNSSKNSRRRSSTATTSSNSTTDRSLNESHLTPEELCDRDKSEELRLT